MLCSVIIPARNAARTIGECLLAVLSQSVPRSLYEIIVVDDGSTDATARIARSHNVRVIPQPPLGVAAARNTGARAARGEILLFVDADCVPTLDWISQMLAPFEDPIVVGVKGAYLTRQEDLLPRLVQIEYEEKYRRLERFDSIDFIDGYSAAYRRSAFLAAGGFDATLAAAEDVELSFRLAKSGQRLVFAPKAHVFHYHGENLRRYAARKLRYGLWRSLVYARHPDKVHGDSHTPPELKAQIPLAGLALGTALLGTRWPKFFGISGLLLTAFTVTTAPFAWRARRAGIDAALAAPGLLFVRALGLGLGLAVGSGSLIGQRLAQRISRFTRAFRY
ncbi:MAG TPA: glycosyltransferase [Chloroflexota bacterium]|nr:glycosyltransferase [Chloroflexota bacterium]